MPTTATQPKVPRYSPVLAWFKTQAEEVDGGVMVPALLFVTGTHTDMGGNTQTFEQKDLKRIVSGTKKYAGGGDEIPVFEANHEYSNSNKIGFLDVDQGLTVEEITAENLPNPKLTDLIGEFGIYGHVKLTRTDAVERYGQTLIKPVSIAFDPSGEFVNGNKWAIFEVSAVPWGAVRGAMLFSRYPAADYAPANNAGDRPRTYALTLDGAIAEKKGKWDDWDFDEDMTRLMMLFNDVIGSIRHTTDEELQGRDRDTLIREAIADLQAKLQEMLGVARSAPPPVSVNSRGPIRMSEPNNTPTPETPTQPVDEGTDNSVDLTALTARIEALEAKNQELEQRAENAEQAAEQLTYERQVSDRVTKLKNWADKLVQLGKLTPAACKEWFPEDEQHGDRVIRFAKPATDQEPSGEARLTKIEAALEYADQYAEPVRFGSVVAQNSSYGANPYREDEPSEAEQQQISDVAKAAASKRYY